ncbi:alpha/beta hydrolase [Nonomuraea helvata]|uniref:Alpha/beta hydrolase n=1 Tax=Nonomuraea helvata TaxID=37484 RepID=A0ABV5RTL7_9ACTN
MPAARPAAHSEGNVTGTAVTRASLQADLLAAQERAIRLNTRVQQLEKRLSQVLGEQAWRESDLGHAPPEPPTASLYDQLVARANRAAIPAKGTTQTVTGQDIQAATQHFLGISSVTWPPLAAAIKQALGGDATAFTHDADKTILDHVQLQATACLDQSPAATTYTGLARLERLAHKISPHLGGQVESWTNLTGCLGWPAPAHSPAPATPVKHAPPALILESTPQVMSAYPWAFGFAAQLPGSRVLSANGDDYTTYLLSSCVAKYTDNYLVNRALPAAGTLCN